MLRIQSVPRLTSAVPAAGGMDPAVAGNGQEPRALRERRRCLRRPARLSTGPEDHLTMSSTLAAAFAFASHGDWARVVPAAKEALASDPQHAGAHALLALGLAHLEQGREAVDAGRRAVALDPEL